MFHVSCVYHSKRIIHRKHQPATNIHLSLSVEHPDRERHASESNLYEQPHLCNRYLWSLFFARLRFILLPISQHITDPRTIRQLVHLLEILFRNLEGLRGHVGNILPHKLVRVDACFVDVLQQEAPERLDPRAQKGAVERHVDALERNSCETSLKIQGFGLRLCLLDTLTNNFAELAFDLFERKALHEGLNVDILSFEEVGDIGKTVQSTELNTG